MLVAGLLKFDPEGRVILSTELPVDFNGGTPIAADGGLSSEPGGLPDNFLGGIGYTSPGQLTDSDNPLIVGEGPVTDPTGSLRVSNNLPVFWYAGLPLDGEGRLCISPGIVPPVDLGEFDFGFDMAFDIGV